MRNYNQTKQYIVTFNTPEIKPKAWKFEMGEHPTKYGNGSSVAVFVNDEFRWMIDTRYDYEIMNDFGAWCLEYLNGCLDPAYEPKIAEA